MTKFRSEGDMAGKATRSIHCCICECKVHAQIVTGQDVYPHRPDLAGKSFWRCPECNGYVGCHPGSQTPLGIIPTPALRVARNHIHALLDPLWRSKRFRRTELYAMLSERLGWNYHTAMIRSVEEARTVYRMIRDIARQSDKDAA